MSTREELLKEIDAFLQQTGMTKSVFGTLAANDDKFVERVRGGAGFTVRKLDSVRKFMRENKPEKASKPRPKKAAAPQVAA
jgi:hypothetical protein